MERIGRKFKKKYNEKLNKLVQYKINLHSKYSLSLNKKYALSLAIFQHQEDVAELADRFGKYLNFDPVMIKNLKTAAKKHDIGKNRIDMNILNKAEELTYEEFEIIKLHTLESAIILMESQENETIIEAVLCHHESYDGTGYPIGLKGDEIPYISRVLKICDVYDALTHSRPYRPKALTDCEAIAEMDLMINQFDPYLYKCFTNFIQNQTDNAAELKNKTVKS